MKEQVPGDARVAEARVLIVEDDDVLRTATSELLEAHQCVVVQAATAERALQVVAANVFDILLLDWGLPGLSGIDVCRSVRDLGYSGPVAVLTGRGDVVHQIEGHKSGADHYWVKPVPPDLLVARIRAAIAAHRARSESSRPVPVGNGWFDPARRMLSCGDRAVELASKHAGILEVLLRARGGFVAREVILGRVWRYSVIPRTRTLDNYVVGLRRILADVVGAGVRIHSRRGGGYRIVGLPSGPGPADAPATPSRGGRRKHG